MFQDNNLWLLLFAVVPAIIYSLIIFRTAPKGSIKVRSMWAYIAFGFLSIQILNLVHFIFPHIHEYVETIPVLFDLGNGFSFVFQQPTMFAIFIFAFFQVAFFEEISKWIALKLGNLFNRGEKKKKNTLFSIMFYSTMIAVGFAAFENVHYLGRALWGDLKGVDTGELLIGRSLNSVIVHMLCGLFMGYFIALGRIFASRIKRIGMVALGILVAVLFHGFYDFNLMRPDISDSDFVQVLGSYFHALNNILIGAGLIAAYFMGKHLLKIDREKKDEELLS